MIRIHPSISYRGIFHARNVYKPRYAGNYPQRSRAQGRRRLSQREARAAILVGAPAWFRSSPERYFSARSTPGERGLISKDALYLFVLPFLQTDSQRAPPSIIEWERLKIRFPLCFLFPDSIAKDTDIHTYTLSSLRSRKRYRQKRYRAS